MLNSNIIKYLFMFIGLVLLQVLILNKISVLGYAIPFAYIYFVMKLPFGINKNVIIFLGFLLGFTIDIFCNTPGINAAATTLMAFICRPIQGLFFMLDDYKEQTPSYRLLGFSFMKYAISLTLIHHILLVIVESFSFFNIKLVLLRIVLSTILTSIIIFAFEGFSTGTSRKGSSWQKT